MRGATLVQRKAEHRALADFLDRAKTRSAGLVVEGEAGIGKTTLMLGVAGEAEEQGCRVLSAQGAPTEVAYAYAAVADLMGDVGDAALAAIPRVQRTALERARLGDLRAAGPPADERGVATAFLSVIDHLSADAPVLMVVDDLQWLDASSRAVLAFAARRLNGRRVGLLVTVRREDAETADVADWLQFSEPDALRRLRVRPMSLGEVHALVSQRLGRTLPRPVITRIHRMCGGNPFFALELAHGIAESTTAESVFAPESLPSSVTALVHRRIGAHDVPTAAALLVVACSPAPTMEMISHVTETSVDDVVGLLERVETDDVVLIDGNRIRFAHPLYATGVYTAATAGQRRATHRALAEIDVIAESRARHLALAATTADPSTRAALDAAADVVRSQGAPAVAAELVELAIHLDGDTEERRIRFAELHFRAGSLLAARRHLQSAIDRLPVGETRCLALMLLGAILGYDDDMGSAVQAMTRALEDAGDNTELRTHCLLRLAPAMVMVERSDMAVRYAEDAVAQANLLGTPDLRSRAHSVLVVVGFVHGLGVDYGALRTAVELEVSGGDATTWYQASAVDAMVHAWTGELDTARGLMSVVQQQMLEGGTEIDIIWAANHLAGIDVWMGRYAEAARGVDDSIERAEQMNGRHLLVTVWGWQAATAAYRGLHDEARAHAGAAIAAAHESGAHDLAAAPRATLAFVEVSLGDYVAASTALEPLLAAFDPAQTEMVISGWLPDAVETLTGLGRADAAIPLVEALEHNGTRHDRPWMLAMAARGRGHILAAQGDLAGAQNAIEQAIIQHGRLPMPFETARTRLLLGQTLRRRRRRSDAAVALRDALDTFEHLGTPAWAARARAELARLRQRRGDGNGLTPAESRIARLAAQGLSNKQIAAEAFVAEKTVEMNLSRAYRKLGIRSRSGLAGALRSQDIPDGP